uniref:Mitochondrial rRNA methyltransferase 3 n=1 Tax=Seriola dumerili TaxID=41447 RepID=A0A3B4UC41_SERDU
MAAYVRSVICLVSREQRAFLTRGNDVVVASKRYVRGLRRKPVRVLFPDDEAGTVVKTGPQSLTAKQHVKREKKEAGVTSSAAEHLEESGSVKARSNVQSAEKHAHLSATKDRVDGLRFERAFPGDKRLARLVSVARSRTFREHQGKILLEGKRLICDALNAGANPQMVFFSTVDRLRELPLDKLKRATLVKVKFEDIKIWSDLVAPQGPYFLTQATLGLCCDVQLLLDAITKRLFLFFASNFSRFFIFPSTGCVDAWEPKVLRAAMGAHFRLPIYPSLDWDKIQNHLPKPVTVHVADSSCGPDRSRETEDLQVNISHKPSKAGDYGWVSTRRSHSNVRYEDYDADSDSDSEDEGLSLPIVDTKLYYESWAQSPTALVIGGETHGLSLESVQLAEKTAGHRLFIPVVPDVDSLNSAMAASILLFEGRRQLLKLMQTSGRKWKSKVEGQFS